MSNAFGYPDGYITVTDNLDFNNNKGINLVDPTNAQDAATKAYADASGGGVTVPQNQIPYGNLAGDGVDSEAAFTYDPATNSMNIDGRITLDDGTAGAPAFAFESGGQDDGLYKTGTNQISLSTGGSERIRLNSVGNGQMILNPQYTTPYQYSMQSSNNQCWLEILNSASASGKGAFFGMFNNDFEIYNYDNVQGDIHFYLLDALTTQVKRVAANGTNARFEHLTGDLEAVRLAELLSPVGISTLADNGLAITTANMRARYASGVFTAPRSKVTQSATLLLATFPGAKAGSTYPWTIANSSATNTLTITAGAGCTLASLRSLSHVLGNVTADYIIRWTNVGGSPAYTLTRIR